MLCDMLPDGKVIYGRDGESPEQVQRRSAMEYRRRSRSPRWRNRVGDMLEWLIMRRPKRLWWRPQALTRRVCGCSGGGTAVREVKRSGAVIWLWIGWSDRFGDRSLRWMGYPYPLRFFVWLRDIFTCSPRYTEFDGCGCIEQLKRWMQPKGKSDAPDH
jgi:hypothetical protein